ncbi:MAG: hypothetical protein KAS77_02585 [Thermoplasmata archaeon]|jgi:hypothetical protein|nr:hypothetical protein [Thermoplasmata archaeon]NOQ53116.1 hypothetical protein [Thermoplasmata archaeon]
MDTILLTVLLVVILAEAVAIALLYRRTKKLQHSGECDIGKYCGDRIAFEMDCLERKVNSIGRAKGPGRSRR